LSSEASAARITGVATKGVRVQGRVASQHDPLDRSASELAAEQTAKAMMDRRVVVARGGGSAGTEVHY
tara:strand:+ start:1669 stop:1872 length:204 start_codon:yes stop_codon:yes gene_type:complete